MNRQQEVRVARSSSIKATNETQRRLLTLDELDRVLVSSTSSRRQGTTYYTLEVYLTTTTTSPRDYDAISTQSDSDEAPPAYRVDKTLTDFDSLRRALYSASHLAHTSVSCEFCKEIMLYIDTGDKRFGSSSVFRVLVNQEKVIRSLQQFMDDILDMLLHFACIEGTPWCSSLVQNYQVVRQFLLPRATDS